MKRRSFIQLAAAGAAAGVAAGAAKAAPGKPLRPVLFKAGTQQGHSPEVLRVMAAFGLKHICSGEISQRLDERWSVEGLSRLCQQVESFGINLDMLPLP